MRQSAYTLANPLTETSTLMRVEVIALVGGVLSALIGAYLGRKGCADAAAATAAGVPSGPSQEIPCDMSDTTSACYQYNVAISQSGPGMTEQNVGGWMMMGGGALAGAAIGALAGTQIADKFNGIPAIGAAMGALAGAVPGFMAGLFVAMLNIPCGAGM